MNGDCLLIHQRLVSKLFCCILAMYCHQFQLVMQGHAVHMKETYDNMKQLLRCIEYDQQQWQLCDDLKVVALLLTKH